MKNVPLYKIGDVVCYKKAHFLLQCPMVIHDVLANREADNRMGHPGAYHQYKVSGGDTSYYFQEDLELWENRKQFVIRALENRLEELRGKE